MEKLKLLPLVLFIAYVVKLLTISATLSDAAIIASLAALTAFFEFTPSSRQLKEINIQLQEINKGLVETKKNHEELKTSFSGLKMASGYKTTMNR